jgi:glycosyl transferase family 2
MPSSNGSLARKPTAPAQLLLMQLRRRVDVARVQRCGLGGRLGRQRRLAPLGARLERAALEVLRAPRGGRHADLAALGGERIDDVRADEAGAAGDQGSWRCSVETVRVPDVILPVLDEREVLPWVLGRMSAGFRPIAVHNGSRDGSAELARSLGALVVVEPVRGFGAASWAGLRASSSDVVCFRDCDWSLDPADLPAVAGPVLARRADLVLGAREGTRRAWKLRHRMANRALALELRRRSGLAVTDLGPMRAGRRRVLLGLGIEDRRFGWPLEMMLRAARAGWRIEEVGVPYVEPTGRSKVTGTVRGYVRAVRDTAAVLR